MGLIEKFRAQQKTETDSGKPILVLRPNITNAIIPKIVSSLIGSALVTFLFFGTIIYYIYSALGESGNLAKSTFLSFIIILFVLWIIFTAIPVFLFYMNLINREYRFYEDRVEYFEGWLKIIRHMVPYIKITDITMHKTVWNRLFNTATIGLLTPGSHITSVYINYVNKPEKIYDYLREKLLKLANRKN